MIRAIWLMDEYVISDFRSRSVWHKQTELVIIIPRRGNIRNGYIMKLVVGFSIVLIHNLS